MNSSFSSNHAGPIHPIIQIILVHICQRGQLSPKQSRRLPFLLYLSLFFYMSDTILFRNSGKWLRFNKASQDLSLSSCSSSKDPPPPSLQRLVKTIGLLKGRSFHLSPAASALLRPFLENFSNFPATVYIA